MEFNEIIEFTRVKPFKFIQYLDDGAFGKTILLKDEIIDEQFVCKKYAPFSNSLKEDYFQNFKNEIKLLHLLYHKNIVRVFNYYLYPEYYTGYILMEYINGENIIEYLEKYPENINNIFIQVIEGFKYLEDYNILHRDIRPYNIMVTHDGTVKIIDFGFGKKVQFDQDFNKSISLNWWCDVPNDFSEKKYNFQTEIYFIGKLFEKIIIEQGIEEFKYKELLSQMTPMDAINRKISFNDCHKMILNKKSDEINFNDYEIQIYRDFSNTLSSIVESIERSTKFINDSDKIIKKLENVYNSTKLEEFLPSPTLLSSCFLDGEYKYRKHINIYTDDVDNFLKLLKSSSQGKRNIIINNLETKLDVIDRYTNFNEDDIPF